MAAVLLSKLISRARSRADMPLAGFVTDAELTDWLNEGAACVHEMLVSAYSEEYRSTAASIAVIAGGLVPLPATFFKLLSIEMSVAGRTRALLPYVRQERNLYNNSSVGLTVPRYSLVESNIKLLPAPAVGTLVAITYAPEFTLMSNPAADSTNFPNGWEKYAVIYAARQMLLKEESSVSDLDRDLATWDADFEALKTSRDAAAPKQAVDMDAVEFDSLWGP